MKRRYLDEMTKGQVEKLASSLRMILEGWDISVEYRADRTYKLHILCTQNLRTMLGVHIEKIATFCNRRGLLFNVYAFDEIVTITIF